MEYELAVPFALSEDGMEVRPEAATRGGPYTCPDCKMLLILRAGPERRVHFAHKERAADCQFWTETEAHLRAKQRVAAAINARQAVRFIRTCESCSQEHDQPLPTGIARASLEHVLAGGLRADIALLEDDGVVRAVLEIYATHECEPEKIDGLAGIPWAEFSASEVLENDLRLRPRQDHFRRFVCARCRVITSRPFVGAERLRVACPLPGAGEVMAVETCGPCRFFAGFDRGTLLCSGGA